MMNRRVALLAVFPLLTVLCGFGSTRSHTARAHKMNPRMMSAHNRFQFPPTKGRGADLLARERAGVRPQLPAQSAVSQRTARPMTTKHRAGTKPVPPFSQIGFVSATQVAAGGYIGREASAGDFNGDGIADFVTIVGDPTNPGNFSFSVVLSNGDGTFQAPVLTAVGETDPFAVADLNGDGWDDIIFVHQPGTNGVVSANFDVLLSNGDGTFAPAVNYLIGPNQLSGGTVADCDNDGKLDIVAVDSSNPVGSVWVVAGNGDGTFSLAPTSVSLGAVAGYDVEVADLNGDGMLDVTWNDGVTGEQTVSLATSLAAFGAAAPFDTSDAVHDACSTTLGDLNGDGKPEIVSANCTDNTITIYVNNGDGSYQTGVYYDAALNPAGAFAFVNPQAVSIGDVNGDGIPDLVSTNGNSGDVTILLGNGDGTVNVPSVGYAFGGVPSRPAIVADLNGDGLADLMVPDDNFSYVYMKGYGDGTFRAAVDYYSPVTDNGNPMGYDVATGDFNGDGLADVVTGNCCDATQGITVFLSRADGSLQAGVNYGSGGGMHYVAVADFDGDGKADIAATDTLNGWVQIFSGNGDGTFTAGSTFATDTGSNSPDAIVVGDFNGDGLPDLAVANATGSNVGVLLNTSVPGTITFGTAANYATCSASPQVSVGDINGDSFPDLLVPMPQCTGVAIFLNAADGSGTFVAQTDLGVGNRPFQIAVGDLNGDGKADLAITMDDFLNGQGLSVALGNGDGTFQAVNTPGYRTSLQIPYYQPMPSYIRLADLDGDGALDAIYTNENYGTVGVMYGVGDGSFYDPVEFPTSKFSYGLALGDINGDGAVDVVTAGNFTSGATVLVNNSGSGAAPDYSIVAAPNTATVTAGGTGSYTIMLTPRNFYNGNVTFACGTLPSKTTCSFSTSPLTPNGNGLLTTTLSLKTTATMSAMAAPAMNPHSGPTHLMASLMGMSFFGLILAGNWKRGRRMGIVLAVITVGIVITLVGCGGGNTPPPPPPPVPGTPAGTYQVTVTATGTAGNNGGNTSAHTLNVTLVVQ